MGREHVIGLVLLLAGGAAALRWAQRLPDSPPSAWHPDPTAAVPRDRYWDALIGRVYRIALVSPLHWLWTGIAVAVLWRQWHLRGFGVNGPVLAVVAFVMAAHSLNDSSAVWTCGGPPRRCW